MLLEVNEKIIQDATPGDVDHLVDVILRNLDDILHRELKQGTTQTVSQPAVSRMASHVQYDAVPGSRTEDKQQHSSPFTLNNSNLIGEDHKISSNSFHKEKQEETETLNIKLNNILKIEKLKYLSLLDFLSVQFDSYKELTSRLETRQRTICCENDAQKYTIQALTNHLNIGEENMRNFIQNNIKFCFQDTMLAGHRNSDLTSRHELWSKLQNCNKAAAALAETLNQVRLHAAQISSNLPVQEINREKH